MPWERILRNSFSNWSSYLVTAVVGFMLTPIVVRSLGTTRYGLWTLVLSITGYFGLLDLGIRSSVSRFLTRHLALNDETGLNRTASTAFVILACGGIVAFLGTVATAAFLFDQFRIEPEYASSGRIALLITGVNITCILPLGLFSALLYASERFDVVSAVTIVGEVIRAALMVWLLRHGYGLVALALLAMAITLVQYACMASFATSLHPQLRIARRYVDKAIARDLFSFSIYRFISIVANQLIFYSDAVVIGIFLSAGAITPYAIAATLINYGRTVVFVLVDPLFASAARFDAEENGAKLQRLLVVGTQMALLAALPLCLGFVFLGEQFITIWMGQSYASSATILLILAIPQFVAMPQYVSILVLTGMAKHRPFAFIALAEGVANIALSIFLVRKFGLIGSALGTAIPSLVTSAVVIPLYTLRVLEMSVTEYVMKAYLRPVLCAVPVAAMAYSFSLVAASSWLTFAAEVAAMCGLFGLLSYFVCLHSEQRAVVAARVWALLRPAPAAN